jgi:hypothetical protein
MMILYEILKKIYIRYFGKERQLSELQSDKTTEHARLIRRQLKRIDRLEASLEKSEGSPGDGADPGVPYFGVNYGPHSHFLEGSVASWKSDLSKEDRERFFAR